jgi:hypothetical protein
MNKQTALKKIKELEEYVKECDNPEVVRNELSLGEKYGNGSQEIKIGGDWVASTLQESEDGEGITHVGAAVSGHNASLFLRQGPNPGVWYDEAGNEISGYLYFKPYRD